MTEERKGIHYRNSNALCFLDASKIGGLEYLGGGAGVVPELNVDVLGEWRTIYEPTKSITLDEYGIPSGLWDRMKADQTKYDEEKKANSERAKKRLESAKFPEPSLDEYKAEIVSVTGDLEGGPLCIEYRKQDGTKAFAYRRNSASDEFDVDSMGITWDAVERHIKENSLPDVDPGDFFKNTYGQETARRSSKESNITSQPKKLPASLVATQLHLSPEEGPVVGKIVFQRVELMGGIPVEYEFEILDHMADELAAIYFHGTAISSDGELWERLLRCGFNR